MGKESMKRTGFLTAMIALLAYSGLLLACACLEAEHAEAGEVSEAVPLGLRRPRPSPNPGDALCAIIKKLHKLSLAAASPAAPDKLFFGHRSHYFTDAAPYLAASLLAYRPPGDGSVFSHSQQFHFSSVLRI